jgi:hypothetical protein
MLTLPHSAIFISLLVSLFPYCLQAQESSSAIFDFEADVRVFTAQALQNAAGYDHEWRKEGMHPLRIEIRRELFSTLDSSYVAKLRAFGDACKGSWDSWASYALLTSGPPAFALSYDPNTSPYANQVQEEMAGLSSLLAEFYLQAHIPALWQKYRPQFQDLNDQFRPYASQALNDIIQYCRLDSNYFSRKASRIHVVFAPLQSYFTAFTDNVNNEIYLVFGPQPSQPSPSSFYHEALHYVLSPLTEKLDTNSTNRFKDLFALATSGEHIGYAHIDEAFVRTMGFALSGKLFHDPDSTVLANVTNEYKLGFILCLPIYEQLKAYEASNMTFEQFFPRILASIDVEREKQRWNEITKSPQ